MLGRVTRHMLPHVSGVPHLHVNGSLQCDCYNRGHLDKVDQSDYRKITIIINSHFFCPRFTIWIPGTGWSRFFFALLTHEGTLQTYGDDDNRNVKDAIVLMRKTTTLHAIFCKFHCPPCTNTTSDGQILGSLENGNGKAISSTISVWTRAQFLLFSCNINFLLLNNWATWDNREKVRKDAKSIFQRSFHRRSRCWIVKSQFRYFIVSGCQFLNWRWFQRNMTMLQSHSHVVFMSIAC